MIRTFLFLSAPDLVMKIAEIVTTTLLRCMCYYFRNVVVWNDDGVHDCDLHVVYVVCSRMIPENRRQTLRKLGFFKVALLGSEEGCASAVAVDGTMLVVSSRNDVVRIAFQSPRVARF